MLQQSQNLQTQLTQNLQTLVELQTLVAKQQLSKGVVEVQAPTGEKITKDSTAKDSPQETLHCHSALSNFLENPSQELTAGGIGGVDIGGGGKTADAGLQIVQDKKLQKRRTTRTPELQNNKRLCTGVWTRSSCRAEVDCAAGSSWVTEAINQKRSHG